MSKLLSKISRATDEELSYINANLDLAAMYLATTNHNYDPAHPPTVTVAKRSMLLGRVILVIPRETMPWHLQCKDIIQYIDARRANP